MTPRLRDVVVAQHRRLLGLIDRAETSLTRVNIGRLREAMHDHLSADATFIRPLTAATEHGRRYGGEEHVILLFALDRACDPSATRPERAARLRVFRDLLVHQTERDEWLTLELIESQLGADGSNALARRLARAMGLVKPVAPRVQARRNGK